VFSLLSALKSSNTKGVFRGVVWGLAGIRPGWQARLQQPQRAGEGDRFGAPVDLEFAKDIPVVPFDCTHSKDQPLANFLIRASLCDELEYFDLALAERLEERLGRRPRRGDCPLLRLRFACRQQLAEIVRHHSLSGGLGQEMCHQGAFVNKSTDEAAWFSQRQRLTELLYRLVLFALGLESECLQNRHLEPFILPPLRLHLLSPLY